MNEDMQDLKVFIVQNTENLKQYVDNRIVVTEHRLSKKIDLLAEDLQQLRTEVNDGFSGVSEVIEALGEDIDLRFEQVDKRLTKLEKQAA